MFLLSKFVPEADPIRTRGASVHMRQMSGHLALAKEVCQVQKRRDDADHRRLDTLRKLPLADTT